VQVEDDAGGVINSETDESVQEAIFTEVHRKRYNLAEETPIFCGALRGQFGYISTSSTAQTVLDGTYDFPPNMDKATKELFVEIAQNRSIVPPQLCQWCDLEGKMAAAMEKSERRHVLITVRLALWALYSRGRLQIYLAISCSAHLPGSY
jgi:hypothetical protein